MTTPNTKMFCYQCQESAGCRGCTLTGVCGKTPETAALQDLLVWVSAGLAAVAHARRANGLAVSPKTDRCLCRGLFTTITNANFDNAAIEACIRDMLADRDALMADLPDPDSLPEAARWDGRGPWADVAARVGVLATDDPDRRSLRSLITYGLKGLCAYLHHAAVLGREDERLYAFVERALAATLDDALTTEALTDLTLETGRFGVDAMALLDQANTKAFGDPAIQHVRLDTENRPAILISGHDLNDLAMLLEQTKDTGVDVYTHCEMLPAHYYPAFRKYPHFIGNYGNAWWQQTTEFEAFNGPILMTTNCIVPPKASYRDRLYTTGAAGWPGCVHIAAGADGKKDFTPLIDHARRCAPPTPLETGELVGGFAHAQVSALAGTLVDAIQSGAIRKLVVMAGCDGRSAKRRYYTDFARALPQDTVILTAGCAKYRYNKLDLGTIGGIPRVLDAGQCNDSYSLVAAALQLKDAFGLDDINDLPIVYNIAWYEQKAVIVLLALLALGVKNIHLGPTLPAFLSPGVADLLVRTFGIAGIDTVDADLKTLLA